VNPLNNNEDVSIKMQTGISESLKNGPFVIKYDFKSKYPVKGLAMTCDMKTAYFNLQRHIVSMDI
jgi:hypothetical protein